MRSAIAHELERLVIGLATLDAEHARARRAKLVNIGRQMRSARDGGATLRQIADVAGFSIEHCRRLIMAAEELDG